MKWIIGNHKNSLKDPSSYIKELIKIKKNNIKLVICPSAKNLAYFSECKYEIGSQDINLSFDKLKQYNVKYSIVGHSYKRTKYQETNQQINKKIKILLENNIIPILCIGELKEDSDIEKELKQEISEGLMDIKEKIIIAYEPVWAIGSGKVPDTNKLNKIINFIDKEVKKQIGYKVDILYGGSVNEETINLLEEVRELDGYLIGNASIDIEKLKKIIEVVK